ncbi:MAG: hypothetical protein IKK96_03730, partial [Lachnospiraceae bacterium]|nr:hypothetical protein [Lachnospiraceae bacterium]
MEKEHNNDNTAENKEESNKQKENEKLDNEKIEDFGQVTLDENNKKYKIHLLSVIGEIEGHDNLPNQSKTTKYEHVLPQLAAIEDSDNVDGV